MARNDSDIFVIITLWLLYIGIHVCMDFFERRARRSADEAAEEEALRRANAVLARASAGERSRTGRTGSEIRVIVMGAETSAASGTSAEPCEGAVVPDANGHLPQLPAPVQYGEASYASHDVDNGTANLMDAAEKHDEKCNTATER